MKNATSVEVLVGEKTITIETGALAGQADGAITMRMGDTVLFCAISTSKPREGIDFFPMQVEYREKFYSAGRFPGGFFKREARPSEKEILTMRVTDRPIRPLFPEGYRNELQINSIVFSCDGVNEPDMLNITAASTGLMLSESIPFKGPIAAVRIGRIDGKLIVLPTVQEMEESDLNLVYAGTRDKMVMFEGDAKEISEADMVAAMKFAHEAIIPLIDAQVELRNKLGLPEKVIEDNPVDRGMLDKILELGEASLRGALTIADKAERSAAVHAARDTLKEKMLEAFPEMTDGEFFHLFDEAEIHFVRDNVLSHGKRVDGRASAELRPLDGEVGVIPRVHGSAMFSRGETQAVGIVTIGSKKDAQMIDAVTGGPKEKDFLLHYNFPPYSVGEAGRLGATSRREIGHGNLAERSLKQVIPEDLPYSIRIVSEVMSSNGSTSMASVCAGTLAMMDAGIPITKPVAGISVGLYSAGDRNELVIDILGIEDHCGDMDFKVCGTRDGITGFQVDLKISGLTWEQVEGAFEMARVGRCQILDAMQQVIAEPRPELSEFAPRIHEMQIDTEKIGAVIGPGGKIIRGMCDTFDVQIDIDDDGTVRIYGSDKESMDGAIKEVQALTAEAEIGKIYTGIVRGVKDFGAFVEILPGKEGLVHISELEHRRVEKVEDVCRMGDEVTVKCLDVDDRGKIKLSRKAAMAKDEN